MAESDFVTGVVTVFGGKRQDGAVRRFGFVKIAGREDNLFVHANDLLDCGIESLQPNDVIRCRIGADRNGGRPCAIEITLVRRAPA